MDKNGSEKCENTKGHTSRDSKEVEEPQATKRQVKSVSNIISAPKKATEGYIEDSKGRLRKIV